MAYAIAEWSEEIVMTSSGKNPDTIERAETPTAHQIKQREARAARAQLNFEADVARRFAIDARLTAERTLLAFYARARHRP